MLPHDTLVCTDGVGSTLGYFDLSLAPELLNYSYTSIAIIALFVGAFVFFHSRTALSRILFTLTVFFALFITSEIIQWIIIPAGIMHFAYSLSLLLQTLILLTTLYFVYVFVHHKDLPFSLKLVLAGALVPVILLLPSKLNLEGVILETCVGVTGALWNYFYILEALSALALFVYGIVLFFRYRREKNAHTLASTYLSFTSSIFLFIFFISYFYADQTGIYEINLIGPVGKLIFIGMLAYLIVKFKAFNIKLIGAQALMTALILLVASQYFFIETTTAFMLTGITLALALGFGFFLIRSITREVEQKEQIARLVETLEKANARLVVLDKMKSEFVSITSHQLRSPLTSIRGYASMLVEGSYGKLPAKAQDIVERIGESAKYMALSVEDYLNVSRIEAGNMKYEMTDFNLRDLVEKITDEMRAVALKKGLIMVFRSDCDGSAMVHADIGKTRQVIMNLVDNAIKYTPKGTITVIAHDDPKQKKMYVTIHDTGVGMSHETQHEVFEKFVRAKNANNVNVTGTGLGLFVAKRMITDMKGRVWAESEGEGKGSVFHIELPSLPGKSRPR